MSTSNSSLPPRPNGPLPPFRAAADAAANRTNGSPANFPHHPGSGTQSPASWSRPAMVSAPPQPPSGYPAPQTANYYGEQAYYPQMPADPYAQPTPPQIQNPFAPPGQESKNGHRYNPEEEAAIAQWQSFYANKDDKDKGSGRGQVAAPPVSYNAPVDSQANIDASAADDIDSKAAAIVSGPDGKQKTVVRSGGGKKWQDPSLMEWDPAHHRIFVGNLAGEVTDDSLHKAFSRYTSIVKARVVRDKRTTKSKGYGFVSFENPDDFFKAAMEMNGKYIGSHPVMIKRSNTQIKVTTPKDNKGKYGKNAKNGKSGSGYGGGGGGGSGGGGYSNGGHANTGAGVQKKASKTKGGLKILG